MNLLMDFLVAFAAAIIVIFAFLALYFQVCVQIDGQMHAIQIGAGRHASACYAGEK